MTMTDGTPLQRPVNPNLSLPDVERLERIRRAREAGKYPGVVSQTLADAGSSSAPPRFTASSWMSQAGYESGKRAEVAAAQLKADDAATKGAPYYLSWLILIGLLLWLVYAGASDFVASMVSLSH
ncbi:hypothetical protein ABIC83_002906 [Roseateles asaccharophilus]|uniref:hypothetical protein n=1 Tax=Roseateles asaccharophilus TaxID=582607 RepID=UPI0038390515